MTGFFIGLGIGLTVAALLVYWLITELGRISPFR